MYDVLEELPPQNLVERCVEWIKKCWAKMCPEQQKQCPACGYDLYMDSVLEMSTPTRRSRREKKTALQAIRDAGWDKYLDKDGKLPLPPWLEGKTQKLSPAEAQKAYDNRPRCPRCGDDAGYDDDDRLMCPFCHLSADEYIEWTKESK